MSVFYKIILILINYFYSLSAYAATLGGAADNIFYGVNFLTKFFWAACILIGVFLLVGAIVNYQSHRNNPKLVPLSTVITYLFLAILTISIPFLNKLFGADSYDTATGFAAQ
jgi:hypothetical protein